MRTPRNLAVAGLVATVIGITALVIQLAGGGADHRAVSDRGTQQHGVVAASIAGYPRIEVPSVGINLRIVAGDGGAPPVVAEAFAYPGADSVLRHGLAGNTYLYAHSRSGMFLPLHSVKLGTLVILDFGHGDTVRYTVTAIHTSVDAHDLSYVKPTADDRLTLQTCDGWRDLDPRFIVIATRDSTT